MVGFTVYQAATQHQKIKFFGWFVCRTKVPTPSIFYGNCHLQRQSQSSHCRTWKIRAFQGWAAQNIALRVCAGGPDFATLQTGKKRAKRYIAKFSSFFPRQNLFLSTDSQPPRFFMEIATSKDKVNRLTAAPEKLEHFRAGRPKTLHFGSAPGVLISQPYKLAKSAQKGTLPNFHRFFLGRTFS